jgi:hypothetical protein
MSQGQLSTLIRLTQQPLVYSPDAPYELPSSDNHFATTLPPAFCDTNLSDL